MLLLPIATNKLMAQWQGPYSVVRQVRPVTYEIDISNKRKKRKIVHVNMLKRWKEGTSQSRHATGQKMLPMMVMMMRYRRGVTTHQTMRLLRLVSN